MSHVECNVIISNTAYHSNVRMSAVTIFLFYRVSNACLTGGMDTEIADTVRYITLVQAGFSTWGATLWLVLISTASYLLPLIGVNYCI